jgi:hypothetical protein
VPARVARPCRGLVVAQGVRGGRGIHEGPARWQRPHRSHRRAAREGVPGSCLTARGHPQPPPCQLGRTSYHCHGSPEFVPSTVIRVGQPPKSMSSG